MAQGTEAAVHASGTATERASPALIGEGTAPAVIADATPLPPVPVTHMHVGEVQMGDVTENANVVIGCVNTTIATTITTSREQAQQLKKLDDAVKQLQTRLDEVQQMLQDHVQQMPQGRAEIGKPAPKRPRMA